MRLDDQLNPIMDLLEARVATGLGITSDEIYETRETGEATGSAAYVSATTEVLGSMGICAVRLGIRVLIGFHLPEVPDERHRVTRLRYVTELWEKVLWTSSDSPNAIPNVGLPAVQDFSISEEGDPDEGYIMGGLGFYFETSIEKPA